MWLEEVKFSELFVYIEGLWFVVMEKNVEIVELDRQLFKNDKLFDE